MALEGKRLEKQLREWRWLASGAGTALAGEGRTIVVEEWVSRNLLRRFRGEAGLSLRRSAELLGVTYATVAHWERGRKVPRPANFARLAALTGLSIEGLAGEWHRWLQEKPDSGRPARRREGNS